MKKLIYVLIPLFACNTLVDNKKENKDKQENQIVQDIKLSYLDINQKLLMAYKIDSINFKLEGSGFYVPDYLGFTSSELEKILEEIKGNLHLKDVVIFDDESKTKILYSRHQRYVEEMYDAIILNKDSENIINYINRLGNSLLEGLNCFHSSQDNNDDKICFDELTKRREDIVNSEL